MQSHRLSRAGLVLVTLGGLCALTAIWTGDIRFENTAILFIAFAIFFWVVAGIIEVARVEIFEDSEQTHRPRPFRDRP